jgi:tRNA threonylcarbamoyladenosine biosynthesis protein TsaB
MKVLCIDTATRNNWIGLYVDNCIIGCVGYEDRQSCLINLIPSVEMLLKNAQLRLSDLDAVSTVIGPGAWSSLRIGMTTVKQLCLVNQLPLATISTLDLIVEAALQTKVAESHILAVIEAQNGKVYSALYAINNGYKTRVSPYLWEDVQKIVAGISLDVTDLWIVGDGVPLFEPYLRAGWKIRHFIPQHDSAYLSILGETAVAQNPPYQHDEIMLLKPLYVQPSSAEVEFNVSVT